MRRYHDDGDQKEIIIHNIKVQSYDNIHIHINNIYSNQIHIPHFYQYNDYLI